LIARRLSKRSNLFADCPPVNLAEQVTLHT